MEPNKHDEPARSKASDRRTKTGRSDSKYNQTSAGKVLKISLALVLLSLMGCAVTETSVASATEGEHPLWKLVAVLEHSMPFRERSVEGLLQIKLVPKDGTAYDERFQGAGGSYLGMHIERVELVIDKTQASKPSRLSIVVAPQCVSLDEHFKDRAPPEVTLPSPHGPLVFYSSFRESWGMLSFGTTVMPTSAGNVSCVVSIALNPDIYENAIRARR